MKLVFRLGSLLREGSSVLRTHSYAWEAPKCVAITGSSGSGKSTLLNALLGMYADSHDILPSMRPGRYQATDHEVHVVEDSNQVGMREYRMKGKVAFLDQRPTLAPWLSIIENLRLPERLNPSVRRLELPALLEYFSTLNLSTANQVAGEDLLNRFPSEVSTGQLQRMVIAGLLATYPTVILLDEATSALDEENTKTVFTALRAYVQKHNAICIMVTHDLAVDQGWPDEVVTLTEKAVLPQGPTPDLFARLSNLTTAEWKHP